MSRLKILSLEDMPSDAELQRATLLRDGLEFDWACVDNKSDFERRLAEFVPDIILADYNLPAYDGGAALAYAQTNFPLIPMIIVTGTLGEIKAVQLMKGGAADYILKDRLARLPEAVRNAVANARLKAEQSGAAVRLQDSQSKLKASLLESIVALATIVEKHDPYTAGHQQRVARLAVAIAREMKVDEDQIEGIHLAGVVHDVGKVQVPAEFLSKPGKLSDLEFALVKEHARAGYEILKHIKFPWPIAETILQHHERMDGSGYPDALTGEQIILQARILAVADVVEAISAYRLYRPALGIEAALSVISEGRGIKFDAAVVDACMTLIQEREYDPQD
ncbi:MAG: HD domain-containing phosphohydrolase [Gallionella sp.]